MSFASRFLAVVFIGLLIVALVPAEPAKTPPTKEQIAQWIKDLGADDFDKREESSKKLWDAGQSAEAALVEATKNKDEEIRRRAKEILDKFKFGIYPDTPKKVVDLINAYQTADPNTRVNLIRELLAAGTPGCQALMKMAAAEEKTEGGGRDVLRVVGAEVSRAAPALLADGNYEMLEKLLDISMAGDTKTVVSNYSAYYLLRGKLDDAIDKVKNRTDFDAKRQQEVLAYLYRAKGNLKAAIAAAEKAEQPQLVIEMLYEANDWKELSRRYAARERGKDGIEDLGYGAAYHRLAGNKKEFDDTIAAIVKYAENAPPNDKATAAFSAAKALFLNDRPDEAFKVLIAGGRPEVVFEILCVQLRFDEAFTLLKEIGKSGVPAPSLEVLAARTLYSLGEKDKAKPMFAKLADAIKQGNDLSWFEELVDAEVRVGLNDDAFDHAGLILDSFKDTGWPSRLLPKLFPSHRDAADVMFAHLRDSDKGTMPSAHLKIVRTLLEGKTPVKDVDELLTAVETSARTKNEADLDRWILALVDTALLYKKEAAALALLEKTKTSGALLRLGDMYAAEKQWEKAAEQYKAAWEKDKHQTLAMYLYGQALVKSGKAGEGKKRLEESHWLPLGDEPSRHTFAGELLTRGYLEASHRENELVLLTSQPASYHAGEAQRRLALEALAKKDYLKAADGHEKAMLRCLRTYISFLQNGAYVGVPAHVHRLRARGFFDAGKPDEARREIATAQALLPGDVDLAILLVPDLEKRGQAKEAAEVFDRSLGVYEKLCKEYPKCAWAHNSAAWLSVCCRRNLEAAKAHSLKAVELSPTSAGHHDTLAEVYFQLGDKDKAIASQKKAIELDPKKTYFRKQLKRIEAGDPKADRPPENDDDDD